MFRHSVSPFDVPVVTIHTGEYWASDEDMAIATVLGSCVAVALRDRLSGRGGLNHFMLPGDLGDGELTRSQGAKYGMFAMEVLINALLKAGSRKGDLDAKVFGGASVLCLDDPQRSRRLPESNVRFAVEYLAREGIPMLASDVGGTVARKIYFFPRDGRVLLKRFGGSAEAAIGRAEAGYLASMLRKPVEGAIRIFAEDKPGDST